MASGGDRELDALYKELEQLRLQNERLRLESEITGLQLEMDNMDTGSTDPKRLFRGAGPKQEASSPCFPGHIRAPDPMYVEETPKYVTKRRSASRPDADTPSKERTAIMRPATYDGSGSWSDYKAHFDACSELNRWTEKEKGLYLAVSLRGQAQGVFGNLSKHCNDYTELVIALQERFQPPNQTELYRVQLRERKQRASETLSELAQDIRRLTNLAYPTAPADVRETLAKEQFLDSLHSVELRIRTKQARPSSLNDAVRHAVEMEAYYKAEQKHFASSQVLATSTAEDDTQNKHQDDLKSLKSAIQQ